MSEEKEEVIHRRGAEDAEFPQRELSEKVIGAAIEVHRVLGPGLLESVYQQALLHELGLRGLPCQTQVEVPVIYKGVRLGASLRLDLVIAGSLVVEVKSVTALEDVHSAQLLTYLRLSGLETGLLMNFNVPLLKQGLRRLINSLRNSAPSAPLR
jgi:GxxExxY protein